ncbi:hypothetical protein B484DRAFT_399344 [Ochromonadaceae sp. CCMP2298]|nr:hypothetical protein B484DRAFT_399344 [Ochromonadaceae sp. CCMP2298]|mmetsp:Transcript_4059/g.9115  ORF Transcript_4059/g.9115 Transcript_4059/m.9115 type:complete len:168 (-) Transcript_4059:35-538(-)
MSLNRRPIALLPEFTRFHGMLCGPSASQRCIDAFDGRILFMPSNYKKRGIAAYEERGLNLLTYYSLVLSSLTGLSSLLCATTTITAEEDMAGISDPIVTADITNYLGTSLIVRRFEYHFWLPGIRVKMWHLLADGKLTLLEIYQPLDQLYAMGAVAFTAAACAYAYA